VEISAALRHLQQQLAAHYERREAP
jgi:hypothetical protein